MPHNSLSSETDYFMLSTVYDAETNGAGIKLYDVRNKKVIYTTDTYGHEPYCLSCEPIEKIKAIDFPPKTVKRIETEVKRNLLEESDSPLTKIITPTPSEVPKVREIVGETWESRIKYHRNWIYDIQIVPGRRYWWDPDQNRFIPSQSMSHGLDIPKSVSDQLSQYSGLLEVFRDDFIQEIPEMPIVACDIETESIEGQIPQAADPKYPIICICFADNQGEEIALVLNQKDREKGVKSKDISPSLQIERFDAEEDLLRRSFEILKQYAIITTFNGDNFDFPYLHERAKYLAKQLKIGIYSPIKWNRRNKSCDFKFGLHLDLYRFYHNVAIRTYAFGNRYQEETLDAIAQAILGKGKVAIEKEIFELSEWDLIYYCSRDAKITLDLLLFDNRTPLNLMFILSRISRTPIDNLVRTSVSNWVRSLFYYEHRRRGYLIPNPEDIQIAKGTQASSQAIIKGKKYKGATVIDPIPGIHFNVAVLDFACLDEDTEILTYEGWRKREEINEDAVVLTLNSDTNNLEYNKVLKKHEYDYNGKMYHFDTQFIEQLVTPNHRVLYFKRDRRKEVKNKMEWKKTVSVSEAKDMNGYWYVIPYTGDWKGERREKLELNGISLDIDTFLAFYGIFLPNGGIHSSGRAVQIFQSKEPELSKMREIVTNFCQKNGYKFTENEYKSGQGSKYTVLAINSKKLAQLFSRLLNDFPHEQRARFIAREFLMLNHDQLKILWDGLMLGDGGKGKYKGKECYRNYSSVSKQLAEDVQELSIKLGIGAKILREKRNPKVFGKVYKNHISYRVFFSHERKNVVSKQNNPIHTHPYRGKVWCVSTRNSTILARRNGKVSITGNSLYPSIISTFNLSYETLLCNHRECQQNKVPQTGYWVCEHNRGIVADVIGFIKDIRVQWLKPESKKESSQKEFYQILERSLKVLINACLPYDEEILVKNKATGIIENRKIGSLKNEWLMFDVLTINRGKGQQFGLPIFVPIQGFSERRMDKILTFTLSDGRSFRCTPNHHIPKIPNSPKSKKQWNPIEHIEEIPAGDLEIGDEILVLHTIPLSESPIDSVFIPDFINCESYWVGVRREDYKQFSYKINEKTNDRFIKIINSKFEYSKTSKMYKTQWRNLSSEEREIIKEENRIQVLLKIRINAGKWYSIHISLNDDFFLLLGWYVADGSVSKNRFTISQSKNKHPTFWKEIKDLFDRMELSYFSNERGIAVHSNVLSILLECLCGRGAGNKRIPLSLFNVHRANKFLESYFKGDGCWDKDRGRKDRTQKEDLIKRNSDLYRRSFSTISPQLKNQLLILLGATGKYSSVQLDPSEKDSLEKVRFKILETKGRHYRRKFHGLLDYNGTTPVRIKSISNSCKEEFVYDITTGNGWFITTNGVVVHNSYGVLGSDRFQFYCLPVADATTAYGRDSIEKAIQKSQALGITVLYGDTDSLFLQNPTKEQIDEIIKWSKEELSVGLEMEKTYRYLVLSERKKNYFGVYPDSSVEVKGLMGKKRNTPPFLQKGFREVLATLAQVTTREEFAEAKKQVISQIRGIYQKLEKKEYSAADLAITTQLTQPIHRYKVQAQHVKAAAQLNKYYKKKNMDLVKAGQLIRFVKTRTSDRVTPLLLMTDISKVDVKAYKSMVDSTFDQLFGALDIEVEEIATGQVNLMEFFS